MQNLNKVAEALNMNSFTGFSNSVATSMTKTLKCGQFSYATRNKLSKAMFTITAKTIITEVGKHLLYKLT